MTLEIITIPCLHDNYAYVICDAASGTTAVVDAPEAAPIKAALDARGWGLDQILITHHHDDHILGVADLRSAFGPQVVGAAADAHRLPRLDMAVAEGDTVTVGAAVADVIDVSGHTVGHIAYHFAAAQAVFTADSLMALGCGRVFEGTPEMMWNSLSKLAALPPETMVYSGHEYTEANARFAVTIEPDNADLRARVAQIDATRAKGAATVPSALSLELATNPFLRAGQQSVKRSVNMEDASDAAVFAEVRGRKDRF